MPFLDEIASKASQLYVLGDLFDWWIGDDIESAFQQSVLKSFKRFSDQGKPLYFVGGNRDFLLSANYLRQSGCERLADPSIIDLHGVPTLISHGDMLCTQDVLYQRYRTVAHSPFMRWLVLQLPLKVRLKLAQRLRAKSMTHQQQVPAALLDVTPEAVVEQFEKHAVTQMIHGHVHRFARHEVALSDGAAAQRYVLGDWGKHATVILSTPEGIQRALYHPTTGLQILSDDKPLKSVR